MYEIFNNNVAVLLLFTRINYTLERCFIFILQTKQKNSNLFYLILH